MSRYLGIALVFVLCVFAGSVVYAADEATRAVEGTVKKTDTAAKTVVVKTADGTEHTFTTNIFKHTDHQPLANRVHGADA